MKGLYLSTHVCSRLQTHEVADAGRSADIATVMFHAHRDAAQVTGAHSSSDRPRPGIVVGARPTRTWRPGCCAGRPELMKGRA
jgi:hypothetical protein